MSGPPLAVLMKLFWMFMRVNILTTSGPASVGLLYKEAVGRIMDSGQFVQAVGFSSGLPGSESLELAMFVGYAAGGIPGALVALAGSVLPPTLIMFGVVAILHRVRQEAWVSSFVEGLTPSIAVLMAVVAWQVFRSDGEALTWQSLLIGAVSFIALWLDVSAPLVLLLAGLAGVFLFR
jgi:chromate transporter